MKIVVSMLTENVGIKYLYLDIWLPQERSKDELRKRQKQDFDKLTSKLDSEAQQQEDAVKSQLNNEREKILREMRNKHAAELAARPDLSQEQIDSVHILSDIFPFMSDFIQNKTDEEHWFWKKLPSEMVFWHYKYFESDVFKYRIFHALLTAFVMYQKKWKQWRCFMMEWTLCRVCSNVFIYF